MSEINPFHIEHVTDDITQEISADHRLMIFRVENNNPATMNNWGNQVETALAQWPDKSRCFIIHDLHHCGNLFELYMTKKYPELYTLRPELPRQIAIVMPHNFSEEDARQVQAETQLAIRRCELETHQKYPVRWEMFHNRRNALNWILLPSH
jgi:hypothetical protein